jgi:hypothetical protein
MMATAVVGKLSASAISGRGDDQRPCPNALCDGRPAGGADRGGSGAGLRQRVRIEHRATIANAANIAPEWSSAKRADASVRSYAQPNQSVSARHRGWIGCPLHHLYFRVDDQTTGQSCERLRRGSGIAGRKQGPTEVKRGMRPCYAAFLLDPDGNNVEAVRLQEPVRQPPSGRRYSRVQLPSVTGDVGVAARAVAINLASSRSARAEVFSR